MQGASRLVVRVVLRHVADSAFGVGYKWTLAGGGFQVVNLYISEGFFDDY